MTSMLLTASYAAAAVFGTADINKKGEARAPPHLLLRLYFSFEQSRGVILFSFAYWAAEASTIGRTID